MSNDNSLGSVKVSLSPLERFEAYVYNGAGPKSPVRGMEFGKANYAGFVSPVHLDHQRWLPAALGGFDPGDRVGQRIARVVDGVSKTILASEVRSRSHSDLH